MTFKKIQTFFLLSSLVISTWANPRERRIGARIIGGSDAETGQFPFIAALNITKIDANYFCGGTILSSQFILSAAQCVEGGYLFEVKLGSPTLEGGDDNRLIVVTKTYYITPGFNLLTLENDIGIIWFSTPIVFSETVQPITSLAALADNSKVVILGWGQTSDANPAYASHLQYGEVTAISNEDCQLVYGAQIVDDMVCVKGETNQGTCYGDTGAPLLLETEEGDVVVVGVSSFVSGRGCEAGDPSGFIRVFPFLEWINEILVNIG